jgi:hypothetical protein
MYQEALVLGMRFFQAIGRRAAARNRSAIPLGWDTVEAPVMETVRFGFTEVDAYLFLHKHHDGFCMLVVIYIVHIVEADHGDESWS